MITSLAAKTQKVNCWRKHRRYIYIYPRHFQTIGGVEISLTFINLMNKQYSSTYLEQKMNVRFTFSYSQTRCNTETSPFPCRDIERGSGAVT